MRMNFNVPLQGSTAMRSNGPLPVNQLGDQVSSSTEISLDGLDHSQQLIQGGVTQGILTTEALQAHNVANGSNLGNDTPSDGASEDIYVFFNIRDFESPNSNQP